MGEERKGESHATDGVGSKARLPMKQLTAWWRIIAAKERGGHGMSRPEGSESTKTILAPIPIGPCALGSTASHRTSCAEECLWSTNHSRLRRCHPLCQPWAGQFERGLGWAGWRTIAGEERWVREGEGWEGPT